jgi:hypothetical protein
MPYFHAVTDNRFLFTMWADCKQDVYTQLKVRELETADWVFPAVRCKHANRFHQPRFDSWMVIRPTISASICTSCPAVDAIPAGPLMTPKLCRFLIEHYQEALDFAQKHPAYLRSYLDRQGMLRTFIEFADTRLGLDLTACSWVNSVLDLPEMDYELAENLPTLLRNQIKILTSYGSNND